MARSIFWLGIPTTTTAVVVVRSTANGTVTVTCNGSSFTETAATATRDGLVKITVTGLSQNTKYSYSVSTPDGDSGSATLKTFPEDGNVKIIYYSCSRGRRDYVQAVVQEQDPHCVVCIGDFNYFEVSEDYGAFTSTGLLGGSTDPDDTRAHYLANHAMPMFRRMAENIPFGIVSDDHEMDIQNYTWDEMAAKTDEADAHAEAEEDYSLGNPTSPYPTDDTAPFYFSFVCGNTEVFVLSHCMQCRDPLDPQHGVRDGIHADNGCLGRGGLTHQEDWLVAGVAASAKKYKLILTPKMTLKSSLSNPDAWNAYSTEMNRVLQGVHDTGAKGIIWGCGDFHSPSIHASTSGVDGATFDHVAVTACSFLGRIKSNGDASNWTVWSYIGPSANEGDPYYTGLHGVVDTDKTKIQIQIKTQNQRTMAKVAILAGTNTVMDDPVKVAIG